MCEKNQYCAYSHFSAMLARSGGEWLIAMFTHEIYWDDSGTHAESPIAVAAAYVSTKDQWDQFNWSWDEARQEEGFKVFHMTDFMAKPERGIKPFCDWDQNKRKRVYFKLANIINTRVRKGFAISIPKAVFDAHASERFRREYASSHYAFAVRNCMGLVDLWHEQYAKGKGVQYIFDYMTKGRGEIGDNWKMADQEPEAAEKGGFRPDGWSFENKEIFKPLQAADILAWNVYAAERDRIKQGSPGPVRPYFKELLANRPMAIHYFDDATMKQFFDDQVEYEKKHGHWPWAIPQWKRSASP